MVIHRDEEAGVVCVGQASHAWISGQLARAWGNDRFARPDPLPDVCLGAEQHDVGMAEWDLAPDLDPATGWPRSFMDMPLAMHLELWSRAPSKLLTQSPYAALLTSMHGHALYAHRDALESGPDEDDGVQRFLREQEAFQRDLLARLDEDPARARHNQRLVWAVDFVSLAILLDWSGRSTSAPTGQGEPTVELTARRRGPARYSLDPWPFPDDRLAVRCHGRRLTEPSRNRDELHARLHDAHWLSLSFELTPA